MARCTNYTCIAQVNPRALVIIPFVKVTHLLTKSVMPRPSHADVAFASRVATENSQP